MLSGEYFSKHGLVFIEIFLYLLGWMLFGWYLPIYYIGRTNGRSWSVFLPRPIVIFENFYTSCLKYVPLVSANTRSDEAEAPWRKWMSHSRATFFPAEINLRWVESPKSVRGIMILLPGQRYCIGGGSLKWGGASWKIGAMMPRNQWQLETGFYSNPMEMNAWENNLLFARSAAFRLHTLFRKERFQYC